MNMQKRLQSIIISPQLVENLESSIDFHVGQLMRISSMFFGLNKVLLRISSVYRVPDGGWSLSVAHDASLLHSLSVESLESQKSSFLVLMYQLQQFTILQLYLNSNYGLIKHQTKLRYKQYDNSKNKWASSAFENLTSDCAIYL